MPTETIERPLATASAPAPDNANPEKPAGEKCVTVVFNPVSGQGDPDARIAAIRSALAEHGYRCQELVTTPEQGARHFAQQALKDGVDLLAVSGGDGTVMEAMSALVGTGVPIAIFPAGTGNLLSVNLGLPKDVPRAVHAALFGQKKPLDLARIVHMDGDEDCEDQFFAILAGAGYDAWVIRDADREAKNKLGLGAYLWAAVKNLKRRPVAAHIRLEDGQRVLRRRAKSVMIANMGHVQANVEVVPDARPDDGILELAVLEAENLKDWCRLILNAVRGRLRNDPAVEFYKAKRITVELSKPQPMQFDGEESKKLHRAFTVEVVPGAVQVMVPPDAPAL